MLEHDAAVPADQRPARSAHRSRSLQHLSTPTGRSCAGRSIRSFSTTRLPCWRCGGSAISARTIFHSTLRCASGPTLLLINPNRSRRPKICDARASKFRKGERTRKARTEQQLCAELKPYRRSGSARFTAQPACLQLRTFDALRPAHVRTVRRPHDDRVRAPTGPAFAARARGRNRSGSVGPRVRPRTTRW